MDQPKPTLADLANNHYSQIIGPITERLALGHPDFDPNTDHFYPEEATQDGHNTAVQTVFRAMVEPGTHQPETILRDEQQRIFKIIYVSEHGDTISLTTNRRGMFIMGGTATHDPKPTRRLEVAR